jgi:hypothetical protein
MEGPDPRRTLSVDHNGVVSEKRWINHYQPQTLVMGTMLAYVQGFFALLALSFWGLFFAAGLGFGAYGIANDKKWGYGLAVGTAILQLVIVLGVAFDVGLELGIMLSLLFDGALVALLLHRESREYQRIWFS